MIVVACGSSYYASTFAGDFFKILRVFDSFNVIEGSEFTEHDLPGGDHAGLIIVSQSGETRDLHDALKVANKTRVRTLGVINKVAS
jgi:glucosamine--fructose-6-phosphate aminotransferase (isomerizing)